MKKLISGETIEKAVAEGRLRLEFSAADTIVTPQAQSMAEKLGVELIVKEKTQTFSHADMQKIISEVQKQFPGGKYSRAKIQQVVKEVLNSENVS